MRPGCKRACLWDGKTTQTIITGCADIRYMSDIEQFFRIPLYITRVEPRELISPSLGRIVKGLFL